MQRLNFSPDEKLTRKEYLKRKKRQFKKFKKLSKFTYISAISIIILSIYVFSQFYIYSKTNSYKYVADDNVENQSVYKIYYITEGYTYDPKYTLNYMDSNGFNNETLIDNIGISNILVTKDYIYGIKSESLCRIDKKTKEVQVVIENNVDKYTIYNEDIYVITKDGLKLNKLNKENLNLEYLGIDNVTELIVDKDNIIVARNNGFKKNIEKYDRQLQNKVELVKNLNISYMILHDSKVYYINKSDENKIYSVNLDASENVKLGDINAVADSGKLKELDGSKYMFVSNNDLYYINSKDNDNLWKIDLETKATERVVPMGIEILQNVDNTIFYKKKDEMGVYLYNYETKFISEVTKNRICEFFVDKEL